MKKSYNGIPALNVCDSQARYCEYAKWDHQCALNEYIKKINNRFPAEMKKVVAPIETESYISQTQIVVKSDFENYTKQIENELKIVKRNSRLNSKNGLIMGVNCR